ncbi:MAG TPA: TlpA disulfide reductase family protein [Candidatus Kapabacteria bacterium]|nr:TlpA family protein disulfide reductase [Ignavibacteria bacterium]HRK60388.1 TlpA disulfide reductase family protein [Candidatus Kapabacteria bacterium]
MGLMIMCRNILIVFFFTAMTVKAQVGSMNVDQITERLTKNNDTTFIINFWATWCKPCVEELPVFESITQKYPKGRIKVLLVSLDFKNKVQSVLIPFVKKRNLQSEVIWLNEKNYDAIIDKIHPDWSGSLPATLIVAPHNRIVFFKEGTIDEQELHSHILTE